MGFVPASAKQAISDDELLESLNLGSTYYGFSLRCLYTSEKLRMLE